MESTNVNMDDTTLDFRKGRRGHMGLLLIVILFVCLCASNPSPVEHRKAIEHDLATETKGFTSMTSVGVRIAETMLVDQNFLFFSITKYNRDGESKLASIGIGGYVFVVLSYNETKDCALSSLPVSPKLYLN